MPEHQQTHQSKSTDSVNQRRASSTKQTNVSNPAAIIQRARVDPKSLTSADVLQLQRTIGNRAVGKLLSDIGSTSIAQQMPVQRQKSSEGEEPLYGKIIDTVQRQLEPNEDEPIKGMFDSGLTGTLQAKEETLPNKTGMPDHLKSGIEIISGMDLSGVRVHYNSSKPKQLNALAYTQGSDIHLASRQERHLPHEAWHVVQQAQGRVKPTLQLMDGVPVNDDEGLEYEADEMGARAATGIFTATCGAKQHVREGVQNEKEHLNLPDTRLTSLRPMRFESGDYAIQFFHAAMGTMIHYAPPEGKDPDIDLVNKQDYNSQNVLKSWRGEIKTKENGDYYWNFPKLAKNISFLRSKTLVSPGFFPIFINANRMISPGMEDAPKEYKDETNKVFAISSVWGMNFKKPDEVGEKFMETTNYSEVLNAWAKAPDKMLSDPPKRKTRHTQKEELPRKKAKEDTQTGSASMKRKTRPTQAEKLHHKKAKEATQTVENPPRKTIPLGEVKAKALLRSHAKDKLNQSRNTVIPHRGLRNYFFQDHLVKEKLKYLEAKADFVHIITLDSDTDLGGGEILYEIMDLAEKHIKPKDKGTVAGGLHITATDYIYDRDNLFEWLAGALDKVGRKKLEKIGYDAYPAEPGLTISYSSTIGESARSFLSSDPFGPEYRNKAEEEKFDALVTSDQSVEGKNLRERWRKAISDPKAMIHRTTSYVNVRESAEQSSDHTRTHKKIDKQYKEHKDISFELIYTLVKSDTYHSLAPDRSNESKREAQQTIVKEVTEILNRLLKEKEYPSDPRDLKEDLNAKLAIYMNQ